MVQGGSIWSDIDRWISGIFRNGSFAHDKNFQTHVAFLLWHIWKHICHCVFNHILPDPIAVAQRAFKASKEYLLIPKVLTSFHSSVTTSTSDQHALWKPPPHDSLKINTDAAWNSETLSCGIAAVLRDHHGTLIRCLSKYTHVVSSLVAEALAIELGLSLASSSSLASFQLESDSLVLISTLLNPLLAVDWSASQIVSRIRSYSGTFNRVNWLWTSRYANEAADYVADLASRRVCLVECSGASPLTSSS